jgi:hypothetical protein
MDGGQGFAEKTRNAPAPHSADVEEAATARAMNSRRESRVLGLNPKSEIRGSKEGRNPKPDAAA